MNANAESDAASASPPAPAEPLTPAEMARQIAWWKAEAEHYRDVAIGLMEAAGGSCAVLVFGQTDVRLFAPTPDRELELMAGMLDEIREFMATTGIKVKDPVLRGISEPKASQT